MILSFFFLNQMGCTWLRRLGNLRHAALARPRERVARVAASAKPMVPPYSPYSTCQKVASRAFTGEHPRGTKGDKGQAGCRVFETNQRPDSAPTAGQASRILVSIWQWLAVAREPHIHMRVHRVWPRDVYGRIYKCTHRSNGHRPSAGRAAFSPWLSRDGRKRPKSHGIARSRANTPSAKSAVEFKPMPLLVPRSSVPPPPSLRFARPQACVSLTMIVVRSVSSGRPPHPNQRDQNAHYRRQTCATSPRNENSRMRIAKWRERQDEPIARASDARHNITGHWLVGELNRPTRNGE